MPSIQLRLGKIPTIPTEKLLLLHAIRGFAAFYVVVFHAKFVLWSGGAAYIAHSPRSEWSWWEYLLFANDLHWSAGTEMVLIFFVLSGFFIARSFQKNHWKSIPFYLNRIVRIYLPFLVAVLLSFFVLHGIAYFFPFLLDNTLPYEFNQRLIIAYNDLNWASFWNCMLFLDSSHKEYFGFNPVYWSLLVEGIFYLFAPLLVRFPKAFLGISIAAFFLPDFPTNEILHFWSTFAIYFAAGMMLYFWASTHVSTQNTSPHKERLHKVKWLFSQKQVQIPLAILLYGILLLATLLHHTTVSFLLSGLLGLLLIWICLQFSFKDTPILRVLKWLGKISYSLYLIHFPILVLVYALLAQYTEASIFYTRIPYYLGVLLSLPIAALLYYVVEKPSLKIIRWLKKRSL